MIRPSRLLGIVALTVTIAVLVPTSALAAKGGGGGTTTTCVVASPRATIDNTWAWASPGSWGLPGQQLTYAIDVFNNDVGCGSSSFVVTFAAPDGYTVSMPSSTITLASASTGYVWASVTSPTTAPDGDVPLTASVARAGSASAGLATPPATSYYKVYSADAVAPSLYWENPSDGSVVSGRSTYVGFASRDDHAVRHLEIALDGALVATTACDNVASDCQLSYRWTLRHVGGVHTATFTSTDWMGNVASHTVTFTVS